MPCLDADVIAELGDILGEDLNAVAAEFASQFKELVLLLEASCQAGNWPEVARVAHLLKGSAGNLGASPLAARLRALEQAARAGDGETTARELRLVTDLGASCLGELEARGLLAPHSERSG